jgi:tetratricopeptide (TPR) repeat protein
MIKYSRLVGVSILGGLLALNLSGCGGGKKKQKNPVAPKTETVIETEDKSSTWEENAQIRAAIDTKDYSTAKQLATARINESPRDSRAHFLMGQAYFGEGDYFKAKDSFSAALDLSPNDRNYQRELNNCLAAIADSAVANDLPSESIEIYKKLLAENFQPGQTEDKLTAVYLRTAEKLKESGNNSEAEALLREAVNILPDKPGIRLDLADLLLKDDRLMESERILRSLRETNPSFEAGLIAYASLLHRMGEIKQANSVLNEALQLAPANSDALALKSVINNDVPAAATASAPDQLMNLDSIKEKLQMLEKTGNLLEQKRLVKTVTSQYPGEHWALLSLSNICEKLGEIDEALANAENFLNIDNSSLPGKLQLARCLYQKGNHEKALKIIEEIEPVFPDKLAILNEKGQVMARMGNFIQARELWNQVLQTNPEYTATLFNYGQLEMESGKNAEAQVFFEKQSEKEPFNHKFDILPESILCKAV